ncbi:MAG: glycosyltransferase family 2 protein [Candidatus Marsarchaeota archaeon]|nr:glycosyltransferase family 2 protein [Candidatus Marsarchaeota archaeon]
MIIISNYNGASIFYKGYNILKLCLNSMKNTNFKNYKIIIADDSSTDKSFEFIKQNYSNVDFVINKPNGGYAQNMNNAIMYSIKKYNPDFFMCMNNDIIIKDKNWLKKMIDVAYSNIKIGIVGCQLLYPNGVINNAGEIEDRGNSVHNIRGRGEIYTGKYDIIEEIGLVTGAAFLIKKEVFRKIGFLDEVFFMGSDDTDFILRSRDKGYKIMYNGEVRLIHLDSFTSNNLKNEKLRLKTSLYCERGAIYFILKWHKRYGVFHAIKLYLEHVLGIYISITDKYTNNKNIKYIHMRYALIKFNNFDLPLFKRLIFGIKAEVEGLYLYKRNYKKIKSKKFLLFKHTF